MLIFATGSAATAGEQITTEEQTPGIDTIITDTENTDGQDSAPADNPDDSGSSAPTTNLCTGNIGASSGATLGDLAARIEACAAGGAQDDAVDAAQFARRVSSRLDLVTPELHTSPEAPVKALVGLQTWLWVPAGQWTPLKLSATLGDTTVNVTARPIQSRWDMGEATTTCGGPGRVWRKGLGQKAKTTCGYTYKRTSVREPDDKYSISATMRYRITWTCEGDCNIDGGDLGTLDTLADNAQLEVGERQSVVIR